MNMDLPTAEYAVAVWISIQSYLNQEVIETLTKDGSRYIGF